MDILIVAKAPVAGRVKTRLCPPCTPAEAARIATAAIGDTLQAALGVGADRVVVALDGEAGEWLPPGVVVVDQGAGPFERRLARAWSVARGPTIQLAMDTPQVTAAELGAALARLEHEEALLGPALDGGWWALALRTPRPEVVVGIPTSTADTGRRQLARLEALGIAVGALPVRRDVDTWRDAVEVARAVPGTRFAAAVAAVGAVG